MKTDRALAIHERGYGINNPLAVPGQVSYGREEVMTELLESDVLPNAPFPCGTLTVCASARFGVPVQNPNRRQRLAAAWIRERTGNLAFEVIPCARVQYRERRNTGPPRSSLFIGPGAVWTCGEPWCLLRRQARRTGRAWSRVMENKQIREPSVEVRQANLPLPPRYGSSPPSSSPSVKVNGAGGTRRNTDQH